MLQWNPGHFSWAISDHISALRVLYMLHLYTNSLGKKLALNLFVHNNAYHMLGDTVGSSSFAVVKL